MFEKNPALLHSEHRAVSETEGSHRDNTDAEPCTAEAPLWLSHIQTTFTTKDLCVSTLREEWQRLKNDSTLKQTETNK